MLVCCLQGGWRLHCNKDGSWRNMEYPVSITWTPCHYGGARAWFICPERGCGRRVAILYGGGVFACRQCYQLVYDSQRWTAHDRALAKAQRIRLQLGGSTSMFERFPRKPEGMHRKTYERLRREEAEANARSWPTWLLKGVPSALFESSDSLNSLMWRRVAKRARG